MKIITSLCRNKKISRLESKAGLILEEELSKSGINYDKANVIVHPFKTVGVQGDERTYGHPAEIEIMKNNKPIYNYELLERISTRITNEVEGINRVLYLSRKR